MRARVEQGFWQTYLLQLHTVIQAQDK
jgi:hypothetical protein